MLRVLSEQEKRTSCTMSLGSHPMAMKSPLLRVRAAFWVLIWKPVSAATTDPVGTLVSSRYASEC